MGLAISVGALAEQLKYDDEGAEWVEAGLAAANRLLAAHGLPAHQEPRSIEVPPSRASMTSFPYSFIHHLRFAYAHRVADPKWVAKPLAKGVDATRDATVEAEYQKLESHLMCHSDAEGFYFPVDFNPVLCASPEDSDLAGWMLGSSYRLCEELEFVAPALGIQLKDGVLSDEEAARIDRLSSENDGLFREYCAWLALFEAARQSTDLNTAIMFS